MIFEFVKRVALLAGVASLTCGASAQNLLDPVTQPKFVNELPIPSVVDTRFGGNFYIPIQESTMWMGLVNPSTGAQLTTKFWGYNGQYPGPTILARKDVSAHFEFPNHLKNSSGFLPHFLPVDPSIHWSDPLMQGPQNTQYTGPVPTVTHLHGGNLDPASDGNPDAWYTPDYSIQGGKFNQYYTYPNTQRAGTLWYHDHTLGITRVNCYAGMAGAYLITDSDEELLQKYGIVPSGAYDVPLFLQDRDFNSDGSMYFASLTNGVQDPSIQTEFFGPFMVVNGMAWPKMTVEPRPYRFRIVNGSDSRFYRLNLNGNKPFQQIATEGGLMATPLSMTRLTIAPGERYDIIIDFSQYNGQTLTLQNTGKTPFPVGITPNAQTDGQVMQFKVTKPLRRYSPPRITADKLKLTYRNYKPLKADGPTRKVYLVNMMDEHGRQMPMLGNVQFGPQTWNEPSTETPSLNATEIWEIYNTTMLAHPVHLHLVSFQVVNRQGFTGFVDPETGVLNNLTLTDDPFPANPNELGWKDTVQAFPGQVTRIIAKFDRAGEFIWHCHILSHEDHEMMRPFTVSP